MKILICLLMTAAASADPVVPVREVSIDFSLTNQLPPQGQLFYGWKLFTWNDWMSRPSSGPLMIQLPLKHAPLEVFESRAAGVLASPISKFDRNYFQNIQTINRLDPESEHRLISAKPFTVETIVPFPPEWSRLITAGKAAKLLDEKASTELRMVSVFNYVSEQDIANSPKLQQIVHELDITGRSPQAVSIQGIVQINQIALFGSIVTLFYTLDAGHTLVVSNFALGIKKKELDLGFDLGSLSFKGRSVLIGENSVLNSTSGIGAGLPKFSEELFANTYLGLQQ